MNCNVNRIHGKVCNHVHYSYSLLDKWNDSFISNVTKRILFSVQKRKAKIQDRCTKFFTALYSSVYFLKIIKLIRKSVDRLILRFKYPFFNECLISSLKVLGFYIWLCKSSVGKKKKRHDSQEWRDPSKKLILLHCGSSIMVLQT